MDTNDVNSDWIECYKSRTEQLNNLVCKPSTTTTGEVDCTTDDLTESNEGDGGTVTYEVEVAMGLS